MQLLILLEKTSPPQRNSQESSKMPGVQLRQRCLRRCFSRPCRQASPIYQEHFLPLFPCGLCRPPCSQLCMEPAAGKRALILALTSALYISWKIISSGCINAILSAEMKFKKYNFSLHFFTLEYNTILTLLRFKYFLRKWLFYAECCFPFSFIKSYQYETGTNENRTLHKHTV